MINNNTELRKSIDQINESIKQLQVRTKTLETAALKATTMKEISDSAQRNLLISDNRKMLDRVVLMNTGNPYDGEWHEY
jgi:hypothetical protein